MVGNRRFKEKKKNSIFKFPVNPLTPAARDTLSTKNTEVGFLPRKRVSSEVKKLPKWWPELKTSSMAQTMENTESQKEANIVMRGLLHSILQL